MSYDELKTKRFKLKELLSEHATDTYLSWLHSVKNQRYIITASQTKNLEDLKKYVGTKYRQKDCILFGIFDIQGNHIGNIKYEPIDVEERYAVMGILIGDESWRGQGVGPEVIKESSQYLKNKLKINTIVLGVEPSNEPAIKAYRKIGFEVSNFREFKNSENAIFMTYIIP